MYIHVTPICNALVHVIYSGVSGQCSHTMPITVLLTHFEHKYTDIQTILYDVLLFLSYANLCLKVLCKGNNLEYKNIISNL